MKDEYTIIFIGKAGSGKGTQIKEITKHFKEEQIMLLEAGQNLRDFIDSHTYTATLAQESNVEGKLQPAFLAIWAWVNKMLAMFTGQKVICIDGAPRKLNEAHILDEMLDFYERKNRIIVILEISNEWAKERLKDRGRKDDLDIESVETRLNWFNQNSPGIVSFFEKSGKYQILKIHGEQSVEDVASDISKALEL